MSIQKPTHAPTATSAATITKIISRASDHKISGNALNCLCIIAAAGGDALSMTAVARAMRVSTAAVTYIVDRIETCGFITRQRDPEDRRTIYLQLTAKGREAMAVITGNLDIP